jgi:hypothetical protein
MMGNGDFPPYLLNDKAAFAFRAMRWLVGTVMLSGGGVGIVREVQAIGGEGIKDALVSFISRASLAEGIGRLCCTILYRSGMCPRGQ